MRTQKCKGNQTKCHNPGSSQKLKNGAGAQNLVLGSFYVLPSVSHTRMEVCTQVHTMHFCNYINEPPIPHMLLHTQELTRHVILN